MDKRFQVFVSSTYKDLQEERQEVMHALLELDCIPSGMELFSAADESQWSLIKKVIDDCDYYILILGGRYGSLGPEGQSYTEMEYRYALAANKPIIAFLHKTPGSIPVNKSEENSEGKQKWEEFRCLAQQKHCKYWETPEELGGVVSRSLIRLIKTTSAVGWVRADELPDRDASLELLRLRKRVDELQAELQKLRISAPKGAENLAQGKEEMTIRYLCTIGSVISKPKTASIHIDWNTIFAILAPTMIDEADEDALTKILTDFGKAEIQRLGQNESEDFRLFRCELFSQDFQTIKIQFRALGLMKQSEKAHSLKDRGPYWTLTPYGDALMTQLRAIKSSTATAETQR